MSRAAMTARQEQILAFITEQIKAGWAPTLREIGKRFGIASPNGVKCHLLALEKKGAIRRVGHAARAIALVGEPQDEKDLEILRLKNEVARLNNIIDLYRRAEMNRLSEGPELRYGSADAAGHQFFPTTAAAPGASADRSASDPG